MKITVLIDHMERVYVYWARLFVPVSVCVCVCVCVCVSVFVFKYAI